MHRFQTYLADEAATKAFGEALAATLVPGIVIYLHGDLGAGKTALTRALIQASGHTGHVKSPTYTLVEPYSVNIAGRKIELLHFDLYRLSSAEEFIDAGFREYFDHNRICIVEWPEKADGVLPTPDLEIFLSVMDVGRGLECRALSEQGSQCLDRLKSTPPS